LWLFWTTLIGAVVGAVVSGLVSYFQALGAKAETLKRDQQERCDRDKTTAFRIHVTLACIVSNLGGFYRQIETSIAASKVTGSLWTRMEGYSGVHPHLYFTADELSLLVAMKEGDLLEKLMIATDRHNNLMDAIKTYSTRRLTFEDKYGAPTNASPIMPVLTPEQSAHAAPRIVELDELAQQIRTFVKRDFEYAWALACQMDPEFQRYFDDPSFPQTKLRDNVAAFVKSLELPMAAKP
jgi:hypothetical protein